jgi:hypothetical protein
MMKVTCPNCGHKIYRAKAEVKTIETGLKHFNIDETGVRVLDKSLATKYSPEGGIVDVDFQPKRAWCQHCESQDCIHVKYALSLSIVKQILKKKGWKMHD